MNNTEHLTLEEPSSEPRSLLGRLTPDIRMALVMWGVVLPIAPFAFVFGGDSVMVNWQSGQLDAYADVMLSGMATWPMYPLLIYAAAGLSLFATNPARFGRQRWVIVSLVMGLLIGLPYTALTAVAFPEGSPAGVLVACGLLTPAMLLLVGFCRMPAWVRHSAIAHHLRYAGYLVLVPASLMATGALSMTFGMLGDIAPFRHIPDFVKAGMLWSLITAAAWYALAYALALAWWIRSQRHDRRAGVIQEKPGPWWPFILGGAAAYSASWAGAVLMAMRAYRSLPTESPDCYVCTAAARGHCRIVGSHPVLLADGRVAHINRQMQTLKAAEIALRVTWPSGHRALRWVYDRLGPPLAHRMTHPLIADVVFMMLWPAHRSVAAALRILLPARQAARHIERIYQGR